MIFFFARSGARHPLLPAALGLVIGGSVSNLFDRVTTRARDRLPRLPLLALVQPRRHLHRRWAWPFCIFFLVAPDRYLPRSTPCNAPGSRSLSERRASGSTAFSPSCPEIGSRAEAVRLLEAGLVRVDGRAPRKSDRLHGGETIEFEPPERPAPLEPEERELRTRLRGRAPARRRQAGRARRASGRRATRAGRWRKRWLGYGAGGGEALERPGIVHRLDRDTSGLLVVARSEPGFPRPAAAGPAARARARVPGARPRTAPLAPRARSRRRSAAIAATRRRRSLDTDTPREAVTHFELRRAAARTTRCSAFAWRPGRTHQIRVHLAAIGLPVAGDPVYGVAGDLGLERQFLHACRLAFPHPITGEQVEADIAASARSRAGVLRAHSAERALECARSSPNDPAGRAGGGAGLFEAGSIRPAG